MAASARIHNLSSGDTLIDVDGDTYAEVVTLFVSTANTFDTRRIAAFSHAVRDAPTEQHYILAFLG